MKTKTNRKVERIARTSTTKDASNGRVMRVRSSVRAGLDASSKDAAYVTATRGITTRA